MMMIVPMACRALRLRPLLLLLLLSVLLAAATPPPPQQQQQQQQQQLQLWRRFSGPSSSALLRPSRLVLRAPCPLCSLDGPVVTRPRDAITILDLTIVDYPVSTDPYPGLAPNAAAWITSSSPRAVVYSRLSVAESSSAPSLADYLHGLSADLDHAPRSSSTSRSTSASSSTSTSSSSGTSTSSHPRLVPRLLDARVVITNLTRPGQTITRLLYTTGYHYEQEAYAPPVLEQLPALLPTVPLAAVYLLQSAESAMEAGNGRNQDQNKQQSAVRFVWFELLPALVNIGDKGTTVTTLDQLKALLEHASIPAGLEEELLHGQTREAEEKGKSGDEGGGDNDNGDSDDSDDSDDGDGSDDLDDQPSTIFLCIAAAMVVGIPALMGLGFFISRLVQARPPGGSDEETTALLGGRR